MTLHNTLYVGKGIHEWDTEAKNALTAYWADHTVANLLFKHLWHLNPHGNIWKRPSSQSSSSWEGSRLLSSGGWVAVCLGLNPWVSSQKSLSSEDEMTMTSRLLKSHTAVRWKAILEKTTRYSNRANNV